MPYASSDPTDGQRLYVLGDIHGRRDLLEDMVGRVSADIAARPHPRSRLICLGDYIDRGPDSRGVIETLMALEASDLPTDFLLGNHDSYIAEYLEDPDWFDRSYHWLHSAMGGAATLASYGVPDATEADPRATRDAFAAAFPDAHRDFIARCALWRQIGDYVFVHAGLRPRVPLEDQTREDCIWIREPFLSSTDDFGFVVVHGHTIVPEVQRRPNRIAIDTGVAKGGPLTCLVLEDDQLATLHPEGLRPLPLGAGVPRQGLMSRISGIWR